MRFVLLLLAACARPPLADPSAPSGVVQSPLDQRAYEVITLDNGLRALLVSDPDTDMAAAALSVHVGHYSDPPDRHGLAHFLEHMLFMGTDRYPVPDEYRKFVEDHGGATNAGTAGERTTYYFQVEHGSLSGAFDRFARFFVAPSLDPAYVERERNAVNSEYSLKKQDAFRRGRQVRKSTTNPDHPESKFSVGNLDTLGDRPGDPVYEDLRTFYQTHYRADQMAVAVIGRQTLPELAQMVRAGLAEAPNPSSAGPEPARPPPFLADQVGVRIDITPLDERREIELQFVLPPARASWPARPIDYVAELLGHEGEGTLFDVLKAKGWVESISAGVTDGADDYDLLSLTIGLTEPGLAQLDDTVAAVFAAIEQIRAEGLQTFRVAEDRTVRGLAFQFAEEMKPMDAVRGAADALYEYPADAVLDHWARVGDLDEALLASTLAALVPDRMRLVVTSPSTAGRTDRVEPLYEVPWTIRTLTESERARFLGGAPQIPLHLPGPNPYLPDDTRLAKGETTPAPVRLIHTDTVELWHLQDTSFGVPRARGEIELWSADPRQDLRARTLVVLLERQLDDALQAFRYPLDRAGMGFSVGSSDRGLTLSLWGYDDGLAPMLSDLVARIGAFRVDPQRFVLVRDRAVRDWRNVSRDWPIQQARRAEQEVLWNYAFQREPAIALAETMTAADLQAFADALFADLSARVFLHGNVTAKEARTLVAALDPLLSGTAPPPEVAVRRLDPDRTVFRDVTIDHADSTLVVVYQGDAIDMESTARWMMLGQLLDTPFFTELRTEQQLGYNVAAGYTRFDRLPGLRMSIQSGVAGPVTLLSRVDTFLAQQRVSLATLDPASFDTVRDGLVAKLRERDTQLYRKTDRLLSDLRAGVPTFDWDEQVARALEALDRDTMSAFASQVFDPAHGRLVVRSFGRNHAAERAEVGCVDTLCVAAQLPEIWLRTEPRS